MLKTPDHEVPTDDLLLEPIRTRWSPRAFAPRPVERHKLIALFEAARWAPSSNNEQPWRFLLVPREHSEAHAVLLSCLRPGNQSWAHLAPLLILTLARKTYSKSGGQNRHAWHDVGLAVGALSVQATALGLSLHQMGGFSPDMVREAFALPEDVDPVTVIALGYRGDPAQLPEDLQAKERRPRIRRPLSELVYAGRFGHPAAGLED